MEEKKQELLKLIDNLDWEKFLEYSEKHGVFNTQYGSTLYDLEKYKKQPTLEQKLKDLGFTNKATDDLYYHIAHYEKWINLYMYKSINESMDGRFSLGDTDKILSFAKYLKELKEKEEN